MVHSLHITYVVGQAFRALIFIWFLSRVYLPLKTGLRFSWNALRASFLSSVLTTRWYISASFSGHGPAFANFLREAHALGQSGLARDLEDILCCTCAVTLVLGDNLDEAVRDAEEVGLGGGDAAAGEDEVAGAGEAHEGGQAVGAAGAGEDAEARLGEADGGVGGEDAEVRGEGELEAAAEGEGGDGGDGGDGEVGERGEGRVEVGEELGGPTGTIVSARAHLAQGQWF